MPGTRAETPHPGAGVEAGYTSQNRPVYSSSAFTLRASHSFRKRMNQLTSPNRERQTSTAK